MLLYDCSAGTGIGVGGTGVSGGESAGQWTERQLSAAGDCVADKAMVAAERAAETARSTPRPLQSLAGRRAPAAATAATQGDARGVRQLGGRL